MGFLTEIKLFFSRKPKITVDGVIENQEGFSIFGWYPSDLVSDLKMQCANSEHDVHCEYKTIHRPDVEASLGFNALGFHIDCFTNLKVSEFNFRYKTKYGRYVCPVGIGERKKNKSKSLKRNQLNWSVEEAYICKSVIYVSGWMLDIDPIESLVLCSKSGKTESALIARFVRKDVAEVYGSLLSKPGFIATFEMDNAKDFFGVGSKLELIAKHRDKEFLAFTKEIKCPSFNAKEAIIWLMRCWEPSSGKDRSIAKQLLLPLISESYPNDFIPGSEISSFGRIRSSSKVSVIIPLYGRFDFMRYQISHFCRHHSLDNCEILYVVDDPMISDSVLKTSAILYQTYGVAFSVITISKNVGYAKANNIGVSYANSENLILMNSDVLPGDGLWARDLISALNDCQDTGVVGTRLLFEDDTIQHDGMAPMFVPEYGELFFNDHPFKGLPANESPCGAEVADCSLVTAACIAIKKSLYEELGGFDPAYVLGDFEDSDLCLKAIRAGKVNKICRNINLYHLERQSQNLVGAGDWKHKVTIYNAITYNDRWADTLRTMTFSEFQLPHG